VAKPSLRLPDAMLLSAAFFVFFATPTGTGVVPSDLVLLALDRTLRSVLRTTLTGQRKSLTTLLGFHLYNFLFTRQLNKEKFL
jgi:hypothetical protein